MPEIAAYQLERHLPERPACLLKIRSDLLACAAAAARRKSFGQAICLAMDAETFKVVRSSQLSQLAACYPSVQLKEDQAQALQESVSDSSSQPFLAAVVLFLARFGHTLELFH